MISNTMSKASADAAIIIREGGGFLAQQNIKAHTNGFKFVLEHTGIGQANKSQLLDYFKYQNVAAMGEESENKLIVGNSF